MALHASFLNHHICCLLYLLCSPPSTFCRMSRVSIDLRDTIVLVAIKEHMGFFFVFWWFLAGCTRWVQSMFCFLILSRACGRHYIQSISLGVKRREEPEGLIEVVCALSEAIILPNVTQWEALWWIKADEAILSKRQVLKYREIFIKEQCHNWYSSKYMYNICIQCRQSVLGWFLVSQSSASSSVCHFFTLNWRTFILIFFFFVSVLKRTLNGIGNTEKAINSATLGRAPLLNTLINNCRICCCFYRLSWP